MIIRQIRQQKPELNGYLDTYFPLTSTDYAVQLGAGARVIVYATGGGDTVWEMISVGASWYTQELGASG